MPRPKKPSKVAPAPKNAKVPKAAPTGFRRDSTGEAGTVIDTMKQAASILGVPIKLLKDAKAAGCPAFRNSRIYVDLWQQWVKDRDIDIEAAKAAGDDPVSKEEWEIERLRRACRKLDVEYEKAKDELIPKQDVIDTCQAAFMPICSAMERYLDRPTYNAMCREVQTALDKLCK